MSTGWLEAHLGDEGLMILDVQPNVHDYIQEHIPGAVYMNEALAVKSPGYRAFA